MQICVKTRKTRSVGVVDVSLQAFSPNIKLKEKMQPLQVSPGEMYFPRIDSKILTPSTFLGEHHSTSSAHQHHTTNCCIQGKNYRPQTLRCQTKYWNRQGRPATSCTRHGCDLTSVTFRVNPADQFSEQSGDKFQILSIIAETNDKIDVLHLES